MNKWLDVTKDLPIDVHVGQVLIYDFEGSKVELKIKRKAHGKIWAAYTHLYTREEMLKQVRVKDKKTGKSHAIRSNQGE